jgi:hypothetical protein
LNAFNKYKEASDMKKLEFDIILKTARSLVLELKDCGCYSTEAEHIVYVNGKEAEGIYLTNAKAAEIRGGTITVSAADAVGINNQNGFVNFVTNGDEKSWTIKVTDGAGIGMFSSAYIDGEWVDTDAEEEALEEMIDETDSGVALLWPQA